VNNYGSNLKSVLSTAAGPPQVVISPGNSTVEAGSTVVFACVGFGDPTPSITWNTFVQSILEICSAEEADGGQYSCTVGNARSNVSVNFELSVTAAGGKYCILLWQSIPLCGKH